MDAKTLKYKAMTMISADAMALSNVLEAVVAAVVRRGTKAAAVAKKLTDPPMKDATKQEAANKAESGGNHKFGNNRQIPNDMLHPMMDPSEAHKNGMANR
jgi:hypothetical protein